MLRKLNLASAVGIQKENWGYLCIFQRELSFNLEENAIHCFVFYSILQLLFINYL